MAGAKTKGSAQARLAILEYSDFQCPYCAAFTRQTQPAIESAYVNSGKVLLAFRQFPIEGLHPHAFKAAVSAECAARQGLFWEMHDRLFDHPRDLEFDRIVADARTIGLQLPLFQRCVTGDGQQQVRSDIASGRRLRLSATPTFLVGILEPDGEHLRVTSKIFGAQGISAFREAIEAAAEALAKE